MCLYSTGFLHVLVRLSRTEIKLAVILPAAPSPHLPFHNHDASSLNAFKLYRLDSYFVIARKNLLTQVGRISMYSVVTFVCSMTGL
jgi:hypothetical protein